MHIASIERHAMKPIHLKLKPGESQLVYIVNDDAAFSVKRHDGKVAIIVVSRGEWEIAIAAPGSELPGGASVHVTKAIV
jgi:hypothetical protein